MLERNRFYRGPAPANVDRIVWTISAPGRLSRCDRARRARLLLVLPPTAYREIAAEVRHQQRKTFFFNPRLSTFFFAFNHDRPAFKGIGQIPLKQAINWAIDRPALVRAAGYLGGKRTTDPASGDEVVGASIYPLGGVTDRSLAKARALLAKAKLKPKTLVLYAGTHWTVSESTRSGLRYSSST